MNSLFLNPGALILLALIPLFAVFLVWRRHAYWRAFRQLGDVALVEKLAEQRSDRRYFWRGGLWLCALGALVIALARPVWGVNTDIIEVQGVSLVAVLDVSNSMAAQDILPSRLQRAKLALHDLFEGLRGNEVGLVLFAGSAYVQFPLTTDVDSALAFLKSVDTGVITQQGTVIEEALETALDLFDPERPSARLVVLMTDGENHEGTLEQALEQARQQAVTIYTLGYGDAEGAPVPVLAADGQISRYKADETGQLVVSRLDETTLRTIAEQTGGIYQRASASGTEITNLVQTIRQVEAGQLDNRVESRAVDRFGIFVLFALAALSVEMFLMGRRASK